MIYMDLNDGEQEPRRGDRLSTSRTTYYVLFARMVKRRDPKACRRCLMKVAKLQDLEIETRTALMRSAIRGHGGSILFRFAWYSRDKKRRTFEDLLKVSRYG